jgi:hypothetical protein
MEYDYARGNLLIDKFCIGLTNTLYELYPFSKIEKYDNPTTDTMSITMDIYYKGKQCKLKQDIDKPGMRYYLNGHYEDLLDDYTNRFQREITKFIKETMEDQVRIWGSEKI